MNDVEDAPSTRPLLPQLRNPRCELCCSSENHPARLEASRPMTSSMWFQSRDIGDRDDASVFGSAGKHEVCANRATRVRFHAVLLRKTLMNTFRMLGFVVVCGSPILGGCGASSSEAQRSALQHQQNSDAAANAGAFASAESEQRKAQDAHHDAVTKAIDEGKPIPPQPKPGDTASPSP